MKKTPLSAFLIALVFFGSLVTNAQQISGHNPLKSKLDNYLNAGVENGFSGSVLVAQKGKILLAKGYGMAHKEKNIPFTTTTVSTIGSVTKQFTATAILKLVELNKLKVTDSIHQFFNNLPEDKKNISIHQLLTHTAGLVDVIGHGDFDDIPKDQFFKTLFATTLLHQPGSKYAYSNSGYSILARIIEIVSGQDYEHFLNQHLFKPAGMRKTGYFIPHWNEDTVANGYYHNITNVGTMLSRYEKMEKVTWTLKGNGGIHSTIEDMYKWYLALKNNTILPKALFEKLTMPYVLEYEGQSSYYAYGWAIYNSDRDTKIISHNGGNAIFFHDFIWLPKEDVLILLFTNASSRENEVAWPIKRMLFDKNFQASPIKKNLYHFVWDHLAVHDLQEIDRLMARIKEQYGSYLRNSERLNDLGYTILRTTKNSELAVALFQLNTALFPKEGNLWDSLGEAYLANNQKKEAIRSYTKALQLAPKEDCHWCTSSHKALRDLKAQE
ncbi:serine hydrolase [Spongiimicrobium salis]|uniref:serine hydrolase n=1 Tax=Spongiimicrobium salis TaxID=1667022 RepID=UPI00374DA1FA